jgi:hypothetical protein
VREGAATNTTFLHTVPKIAIQAGWDSVPHLSERAKAEMLAAIPPYQRDARSKGFPDMGSGAVYPLSQEDYITDRKPENEWPRAYGFDVGWNETAVVWLAWDLEGQTLYAYDEYFRGQAEPAVHAAAIKSKGAWIRGAIDPASAGTSQLDGNKLLDVYRELGLDLTPADNSVTAGTTFVWNLLSTGQLKVARHLTHLLRQMKLYRRDEKGRIVKRDDHGPDALRYGCMTGRDIMRVRPAKLGAENWLAPAVGVGWSG